MQIILLMLCQLQRILGMYANQRGLAVIEIVCSLAKVEIENVNAVHLFHILITLPSAHVFCDGLCYTVKHPLQIVQFTALLDLHNDDPPLGVLRLDVHTVELVVLVHLV